ncbi:hypothetical protein L6452_26258 [Arctium lappa]|uniref:Uncharacterized protein n=1 Tax=Arctium lappa TaxID=4217 RepID=A0ACB9ACB1_ARCLA|nr:hypothetical protein L6452_26258 [Arctium lappa]
MTVAIGSHDPGSVTHPWELPRRPSPRGSTWDQLGVPYAEPGVVSPRDHPGAFNPGQAMSCHPGQAGSCYPCRTSSPFPPGCIGTQFSTGIVPDSGLALSFVCLELPIVSNPGTRGLKRESYSILIA